MSQKYDDIPPPSPKPSGPEIVYWAIMIPTYATIVYFLIRYYWVYGPGP